MSVILHAVDVRLDAVPLRDLRVARSQIRELLRLTRTQRVPVATVLAKVEQRNRSDRPKRTGRPDNVSRP